MIEVPREKWLQNIVGGIVPRPQLPMEFNLDRIEDIYGVTVHKMKLK